MNNSSIKSYSIAVLTVLFLAISLSMLTPIQAQNRDAISIDVPVGVSTKSGITFGMSARNIIMNRVGFYFLIHGLNPESYVSLSGGDPPFYSAFGQTVDFDTSYETYKPYGASLGFTLNLSQLLKEPNCGLSLMIGISSAIESHGMKVTEYTFYNNPYLDPDYNYTVDITKSKKSATEVLLNYDFFESDSFISLSATGGFNTRLGAMFLMTVGFRVRDNQ